MDFTIIWNDGNVDHTESFKTSREAHIRFNVLDREQYDYLKLWGDERDTRGYRLIRGYGIEW